MMDSLVSVIMPIYNSKAFVEESIKSVLEQTYSNIELILIDDYSNDGSFELASQFLKDKRVSLERMNQNEGQGNCRNLGIKLSHGSYIAFIDSDDVWMKNKLELQIDFLKRGNIKFCCTNFSFIDEFSREFKKSQRLKKSVISYEDMLKNNYIGTSTVLLKSNLIKNLKFRDFRRKQDYIFWLDLMKEKKIKCHLIDESLTKYRKHPNQTTKNKLSSVWMHLNILQSTQNLSYFKSVYYTISWGILGIFKHYIYND